MRLLVWTVLVFEFCGPGWAAILELSPSAVTVSAGQTITVDANVMGIGTPGAMEVGSFDIFVGFNSTIVMPTGVTFSSLLGDPSAFEALTASNITSNRVEAAEVSFLTNSQLDSLQTSSTITLASFSFEVLGTGTATFVNDGGPVDDGNGNLIAGTKTVVPEPGSLFLVLVATACLACSMLWRRHLLSA